MRDSLLTTVSWRRSTSFSERIHLSLNLVFFLLEVNFELTTKAENNKDPIMECDSASKEPHAIISCSSTTPPLLRARMDLESSPYKRAYTGAKVCAGAQENRKKMLSTRTRDPLKPSPSGREPCCQPCVALPPDPRSRLRPWVPNPCAFRLASTQA